MFNKLLKFGKTEKTADIVGSLKETEKNFINSVNAELVKLNAVNQAMYEACPDKQASNAGYIGCTCCNECGKFKGVI